MIILPFMLVWVRELFMATDSLFILSLLPPVGSQSISRDFERGRGDRGQLWREAQGKRAQGRSRVWRFICAACQFVAAQGETNAYGKLQEPLCDFEALQLICNDFHFCTILTSSISVRGNLSLWWHLQLIGIGKQNNEWLTVIGKLYFLFCFQNITHCDVIHQVTWGLSIACYSVGNSG